MQGLEQGGQRHRCLGLLHQHAGNIALRIGNPDLAQIARQRPQQACFGPIQRGLRHQRVDLVALGQSVPHRQQARFDSRAALGHIHPALIARFEQHIV